MFYPRKNYINTNTKDLNCTMMNSIITTVHFPLLPSNVWWQRTTTWQVVTSIAWDDCTGIYQHRIRHLDYNYWYGKIIPFPIIIIKEYSVVFSSVTQSCLTLCDPMDCSTPGFPLLHCLLELAQTRVHRVGDAIQPSHPLLSTSSPAINLSQHQGLFKWVTSLHHVAKVLEFQLQHLSFQWLYSIKNYYKKMAIVDCVIQYILVACLFYT